MVLLRLNVYGKQNEGAANPASSFKSFREEVKHNSLTPEEKKMSKKYRAVIELVEKGVVHAKGKMLMVEVSDDRAKNLINAGYIEEVLPEAPKTEVKAFEAPQKKVITAEDTEQKGATGLAAKLKEKNKKK